MIKTARMSEMTIIYGNRYKPIDKDIEKGLDVASQLFFKGNYKKSFCRFHRGCVNKFICKNYRL